MIKYILTAQLTQIFFMLNYSVLFNGACGPTKDGEVIDQPIGVYFDNIFMVAAGRINFEDYLFILNGL